MLANINYKNVSNYNFHDVSNSVKNSNVQKRLAIIIFKNVRNSNISNMLAIMFFEKLANVFSKLIAIMLFKLLEIISSQNDIAYIFQNTSKHKVPNTLAVLMFKNDCNYHFKKVINTICLKKVSNRIIKVLTHVFRKW